MSESSLRALAQSAGGTPLRTATIGLPPFEDFGDPAGEYTAARESAALFDLADRTHIALTGADRLTFLHNFCTNDIRNLDPGNGCEAFATNVKGRTVGHLFVYADEHTLWLDTVPGAADSLLPHLERYVLAADVELQDQTSAWADLYLCGPKAPRIVAACGGEVPPEGLHRHVRTTLAGQPVQIRRTDWLGSDGLLIAAERDTADVVWQALTAAGARPAGNRAFHTLRIEAAFPWFGIDFSDDFLVQEVARTERAVSFRKGCYLGQEPVARIDALGHVNRELRGLKLAHGPAPAPGAVVLADGKEVGRISSAVLAAADDRPVAIGCLRSTHVQPGTRVAVMVDEAEIPADVFAAPPALSPPAH